ncbi:hypothetical protein [Glycomyces buryatensis]|uniref:Uncharacterized protein n=1 Tax=Glycomyces buryatensis TaxID=2570927 RepID=A0A4S8QEK9_9ACTN|nr:hypothetical protein [Glycomyces buryatensis]THV43067.1 hypothetical protein FAB82_02185 [Glycomyces buryatensis]
MRRIALGAINSSQEVVFVGWFRRGPLTPEEIAERDAKARRRRERAEKKVKDAEARERWNRLRESRLEKAAGISNVELVCHQDTWRFVVAKSSVRDRWRTPSDDCVSDEGNDMLRVRLSGPQLVLVLFSMAEAAGYGGSFGTAPFVGDRVIARRVYDLAAFVVDSIDPDAPAGKPVPPIVVDDRVADSPER